MRHLCLLPLLSWPTAGDHTGAALLPYEEHPGGPVPDFAPMVGVVVHSTLADLSPELLEALDDIAGPGLLVSDVVPVGRHDGVVARPPADLRAARGRRPADARPSKARCIGSAETPCS